MPAFLLPILGKILPYLAGAVALVLAYFGFKRKVAVEERAKLQQQQNAAIEEHTKRVEAAIQKDKVIEKKVGAQIDAIKKTTESVVEKSADDYKPGDRFNF